MPSHCEADHVHFQTVGDFLVWISMLTLNTSNVPVNESAFNSLHLLEDDIMAQTPVGAIFLQQHARKNGDSLESCPSTINVSTYLCNHFILMHELESTLWRSSKASTQRRAGLIKSSLVVMADSANLFLRINERFHQTFCRNAAERITDFKEVFFLGTQILCSFEVLFLRT